MLQEFVLDSSEFARLICESEILEREPIRFIIIGSREGITEQIHKLYAHKFAAVDEWSPIVPLPNTDLFMTILIRYRQRLSTDSSTRKSGR